MNRRIQPTLQTNETECAAACMTMICKYFGRHVSLEYCSEFLTNGREGTKAKDIVNFAREQGFRVLAYSIDLNQLGDITMPAIVHWGFNHYIVIEKVKKDKILGVDPSKGRVEISKSKFAKKFTGIVLTFQKETTFNKISKESSFLKWRNYLKPFLSNSTVRKFMLSFLLSSLVVQLFGLILPLFTGFLIDTVLVHNLNYNLINILGISILYLTVLKYALNYLRSTYSLKLQLQFESIMTAGVVSHLLALPYTFFNNRNSGDLITRIDSNNWIGDLMTSQFILTILDGALVFGYLIALILIEPLIFFICIGIGLIHLVLILLTSQKTRSYVEQHLMTDAKLKHYQIEFLRGIPTIISSGSNNYVYNKWIVLFQEQLISLLSKDKFFAFIHSIRSALTFVTPLILIWMGVKLVLEGSSSLGTVLAANALALAFMDPYVSMINLIKSLQEGNEHLNRVSTILNQEKEKAGGQRIDSFVGKVEIENVSFQYNNKSPYVLREISSKIQPGEKVAIVGSSGSGKTTLGKLLVGLVKPTMGKIIFDDIDLSLLDIKEFRQNVGVVLQDSFLFHGTIGENISFGNANSTHDEIVEAAKKASIHEDIILMPMGYETIVSESGTSLSGGQIQRISLARALLRKPSLLLLDEATSHLDVVTESRIEKVLSSLKCTRIHIAHRLSTVINSDRILLITKDHNLIEGTHYELLEKSEEYKQLIQSQEIASLKVK